MDQLAMAALYVATYRGAAFRHFKETPRFFGFLSSKLGDNVFEWHSKGKWYAYAQCFDDRLKSTITSTNSRVDWLTAKYHKVFRKLVLKEGWDVEEALYEAMKITNFAVKYFKQFKQYEKKQRDINEFVNYMLDEEFESEQESFYEQNWLKLEEVLVFKNILEDYEIENFTEYFEILIDEIWSESTQKIEASPQKYVKNRDLKIKIDDFEIPLQFWPMDIYLDSFKEHIKSKYNLTDLKADIIETKLAQFIDFCVFNILSIIEDEVDKNYELTQEDEEKLLEITTILEKYTNDIFNLVKTNLDKISFEFKLEPNYLEEFELLGKEIIAEAGDSICDLLEEWIYNDEEDEE